MDITIDTTALLAVLTGAPIRDALIEATAGARLVAPRSVHWEVGQALSKLVLSGSASADQAQLCAEAYATIPVRYLEVDMDASLAMASQLGIEARDAYIIACAQKSGAPLLTIDPKLRKSAESAGIAMVEV